jgi:glycosyl transferase family 2
MTASDYRHGRLHRQSPVSSATGSTAIGRSRSGGAICYGRHRHLIEGNLDEPVWRCESVSVIFPTYNEKDSLYDAVSGVWDTGVVDEVIVVDNNAVPGSAEEATRAGAVVVRESEQGYGAAIQRGLAESAGDLLIVMEPDGTFCAHDIAKLLAYADDFEVVFGTRTTLQLIWGGANMGWFLRIGNMAVAKYLEVLFNTNQLTDVGCTMRLLRRAAYKELAPMFTVKGSHFGPEMMVLAFLQGLRTIQVPVNYRTRVGESSVTGSRIEALKVGAQMLALITRYRIRSVRKHEVPPRDAWSAPPDELP